MQDETPLSYIKILFMLVLGVCAFQTVRAEETCARDQSGLKVLLKNQSFPAEWIETTADDGKPLMLKMADRDKKLYMVFDKTREGVWAEGLVDVCSEKDKVVVKISGKNIKVGEEAPRLIKWSMSSGAVFKLQFKEKNLMHVSTFGWSGDFVPKTEKAEVNSENKSNQPEPAVVPAAPPNRG